MAKRGYKKDLLVKYVNKLVHPALKSYLLKLSYFLFLSRIAIF